MHNFDDLLKRCRKYRVKKTLKYIFFIVLLFFSIAIFFYDTTHTKTLTESKTGIQSLTKKELSKEKFSKKNIHKDIKRPTTTKNKQIIEKETKKAVTTTKTYALQFLVASTEHINRIKEKKKFLESLGFKNCKLVQSVIYIHLICNESNTLQDLNNYIKLAKHKNIDYTIRTQNNKIIQKTATKEKNNKILRTKQQSSPLLKVHNTNIEQLKENFLQSPNYNIALIIAQNYYKKANYKNSIIWAKKANQLNKNDAKSWIIYAKSLYALHQDDKARQLLRIYLQYENSDKVDKLLKKWEQEK